MKKLLTLAALSLLLPLQLNAQSLLDKLDRATSSINNASNRVDNASNSATNAASTGGKIASLFSKKNKGKKNDNTNSETNKTVISISNIELSSLKTLNSTIENVEGVSAAKMKYDSDKSTITVLHTGSTQDLLDILQKKAKDVFADKNIKGFDDGEINITLK